MRKILFILLLFFVTTGCETKDNYIDTGICIGKHDCSIYQYLHKSSYDWDSTIRIIQRADMVELFDGTEPITFWGPANHSIRRYMIDKKIKSIDDIPVLTCQNMLKTYIVMGKYMTKDIEFRIPDISGKYLGGTKWPTLGKNFMHAYKEQGDFGDIEGVGAITLYLRSITIKDYGNGPIESSSSVPLASPDIECTNGVVHSLNYNHRFGDL